MWRWLENYFTFTKNERKAIIYLLVLCVVIFILPKTYLYFFPVVESPPPTYDKEITNFIDEYNYKMKTEGMKDSVANEPDNEEGFNPYRVDERSAGFARLPKAVVVYFDFDPNTIGTEDWIKLGFSKKQAVSIENLKSKGFKFYKPEDLKKVYVIGDKNYERLRPYIKISAMSAHKEFSKLALAQTADKKYIVDINAADSSIFERQRGIGPSLAGRIIRYRNRLGGFVRADQIKEVWNFPDSTYQILKDRFIVQNPEVEKIDINKADFKTMGAHPYINYTNARIIEAYRKQHGDFTSIDDLRKITLISDSSYRKMEPYIRVN